LADANPEPERLLKYYRGKVNVRYNSDTGIMHMSVRSFRPSDSLKIADALLSLGEQKINLMNQRRYRDALGSAQMQLERAEKNAADIQREITIFRQKNQDVDPELSGQAQIKLVAELNSKLASLRAQLISVGVAVSRESPQYRALQNQVSALEAETASQARKMGGANAAIASTLGKYEALKIRQELAAKNYEAAAVGLQRAAEQAQKQQLYFITIVSPNLPVRSLYPKREELILTLFCFLLISYGIGWLIFAGMREHEA
jgi:capsular polysaccharide transport system permease protein